MRKLKVTLCAECGCDKKDHASHHGVWFDPKTFGECSCKKFVEDDGINLLIDHGLILQIPEEACEQLTAIRHGLADPLEW